VASTLLGVAVAVGIYQFVPRYEIRSVGDIRWPVRIDRWKGDLASAPEPKGTILDGGMQYAYGEKIEAFRAGLTKERQRAMQRRQIALAVIAAAVAAGSAVLLFARQRQA